MRNVCKWTKPSNRVSRYIVWMEERRNHPLTGHVCHNTTLMQIFESKNQITCFEHLAILVFQAQDAAHLWNQIDLKSSLRASSQFETALLYRSILVFDKKKIERWCQIGDKIYWNNTLKLKCSNIPHDIIGNLGWCETGTRFANGFPLQF